MSEWTCGAELEAIAGMAGILTAARRPVVVCELHPPLTPEQFRDALAVHGDRCELLDAQYTGWAHDIPVHILAVPSPAEPEPSRSASSSQRRS